MDVGDVVSVTLTLDTKGPKRKGFGIPLILSTSTSATWTSGELTRSYSSISAVGTDFGTTTPEYLAAQAAFNQTPKPSKVIIGRLTVKPAQRFVVGVATLLNSTKYAFLANGQEIDMTSDASALVTEIISALKTDLDSKAISGWTTTLISAGAELQIDIAAGTYGHVQLKDGNGVITGPGVGTSSNLLSLVSTAPEPGTPLATQLNAILAQNSDWYCLINPYYSKDDCVAIATWVQGVERIYLQATPDTPVVTTVPAGATDIAATLKSASRSRTAVLYHHEMQTFADAAWAGKRLPINPGKDNWAFAELSGPSVSQLSDSHIANAVTFDQNTGKNANVYVDIGGLGSTWNGRMADGTFIDLIRGGDWVVAELRSDMFDRLHGDEKIPQTEEGIAIVEAILRAVIKRAQDRGILSKDKSRAPKFTIPTIEEISSGDLQNRILPNMDCEAWFAGAFNHVKFNLSLRV
jgi:hypothetical protein